LNFEENLDRDISLEISEVLVRYSLGELVHALLENNKSKQA